MPRKRIEVEVEQGNLTFRVTREDFAESVSWVARTIPPRPPIPVLSGLLLEANGNGLTLSGFDYEVSTQITVAAEVTATGQALVSGRLLAEITKALPFHPVEVAVNSARLDIVCGKAKFSLPLMPVEDYPQLPDLPEQTGSIESPHFAEAIAQVAIAAGKDDTLPMLTGIRFEISQEVITLTATDRFRLAIKKITWQPNNPSIETAMLVPAKTLSELAKTLSDTNSDSVELNLGTTETSTNDGLFGVVSKQRRTTTRLLDAEFPKVAHLIPKDHSSAAVVEIAALLESIKRVALVVERGSQIQLDFTGNSLILRAGGEDLGQAEEQVDSEFFGEPLIIAFNHVYLSEGLQALTTNKAVFGFSSSNKAAIIKPMADEDSIIEKEDNRFILPSSELTYLLMPVRLPN